MVSQSMITGFCRREIFNLLFCRLHCATSCKKPRSARVCGRIKINAITTTCSAIIVYKVVHYIDSRYMYRETLLPSFLKIIETPIRWYVTSLAVRHFLAQNQVSLLPLAPYFLDLSCATFFHSYGLNEQ